MPTVWGRIERTSPTSFFGEFKWWFVTYKGQGTFTPEVPNFLVPEARLDFDLFGKPKPKFVKKGTVDIWFSGTVGPNNIDIRSPFDNAHITGALAWPIDKQYSVSGNMILGVVLDGDEDEPEEKAPAVASEEVKETA